MKFFFPELGFCFGGQVITAAAETVATEVPTSRRRIPQGSSTAKHWRPALKAIAEDGSVCRQSAESAAVVRSEKKPLIKNKPAGKTRSYSYGNDYRKSVHTMALPAFSPTPFVF